MIALHIMSLRALARAPRPAPAPAVPPAATGQVISGTSPHATAALGLASPAR